MPSLTYIQTSGDLPAVGQARLHAPDEHQPHPIQVSPNSTQFCKSRLKVEIQTGRFAVQPRERIIRARTTTSAAESQNTISQVLPRHAITGMSTCRVIADAAGTRDHFACVGTCYAGLRSKFNDSYPLRL